MSEGEHTIIGKIPRQRSNQIAARTPADMAIQLDRPRQPIGSPRRLAVTILAANFVPEASGT